MSIFNRAHRVLSEYAAFVSKITEINEQNKL